jgi:hypothetical protein
MSLVCLTPQKMLSKPPCEAAAKERIANSNRRKKLIAEEEARDSKIQPTLYAPRENLATSSHAKSKAKKKLSKKPAVVRLMVKPSRAKQKGEWSNGCSRT